MSLTLDNNKRRYKKALIVMLVVVVAMSLLPLFFQENAVAEGSGGDNTYNPMMHFHDTYYPKMKEKNSLTATAYSFLCIIEQSHPDYNMLTIAGEIVKLGDYGTQVTFDGGNSSTHFGLFFGDGGEPLMHRAYKVMVPVGMALLVLYFLIEILSDTTMDNFNTEHFMRKLIVLAVCAIIIIEGANIFSGIVKFGDDMVEDTIDAVGAANLGGYELSKSFYEEATDSGTDIFSTIKIVIRAVGVIIDNLIFYLLMLVVIMVIYFTALGRTLELIIRFIFAPLGISTLVCGNSPARSAGIKYVKQFASLCLQGAVIVGAVGASMILKNCLKDVASILACVLIPLTLLGLLSRTRHIADDIIGVSGNSL